MRSKKYKEKSEDERISFEVDRGKMLKSAETERTVQALEKAKMFVASVKVKKETYTFEYKNARVTATMPKEEWVELYEQRRIYTDWSFKNR